MIRPGLEPDRDRAQRAAAESLTRRPARGRISSNQRRDSIAPMPLGHVLYESGDKMRHVYFPTTSSFRCCTSWRTAHRPKSHRRQRGHRRHIAVHGRRDDPEPRDRPERGHGYRVTGKILKDEFDRAGPLQHLLLRYTQALITQMAQTAVCNRHHSVEQQLCRWLLLSLDRLASNELSMTQELIANMLGVRREGVTEAAGKLQKLGLIKYSRGRIKVLDRPALEAHACECYQWSRPSLSGYFRRAWRRSAQRRRVRPKRRRPESTKAPSGPLKRSNSGSKGSVVTGGPALFGVCCRTDKSLSREYGASMDVRTLSTLGTVAILSGCGTVSLWNHATNDQAQFSAGPDTAASKTASSTRPTSAPLEIP